jgi:hypothetical protein
VQFRVSLLAWLIVALLSALKLTRLVVHASARGPTRRSVDNLPPASSLEHLICVTGNLFWSLSLIEVAPLFHYALRMISPSVYVAVE